MKVIALVAIDQLVTLGYDFGRLTSLNVNAKSVFKSVKILLGLSFIQ